MYVETGNYFDSVFIPT